MMDGMMIQPGGGEHGGTQERRKDVCAGPGGYPQSRFARRGPRRRRHAVVCVLLLVSVPAMGQEKGEPAKTKPTDDELARRLIRKAVNGADEDVMATIIRLMDESARKLEIDFNVGDETGRLQQRILVELDLAIKTAAAQRRLHRAPQQSSSGDQRRKPKSPQRGAAQDQRSKADGTEASSSDAHDAGTASSEGTAMGGELLERRRAWGHLPAREREEIIQGIGDRFIERYREWIERYYRALQEAEE